MPRQAGADDQLEWATTIKQRVNAEFDQSALRSDLSQASRVRTSAPIPKRFSVFWKASARSDE